MVAELLEPPDVAEDVALLAVRRVAEALVVDDRLVREPLSLGHDAAEDLRELGRQVDGVELVLAAQHELGGELREGSRGLGGLPLGPLVCSHLGPGRDPQDVLLVEVLRGVQEARVGALRQGVELVQVVLQRRPRQQNTPRARDLRERRREPRVPALLLRGLRSIRAHIIMIP